MKWVNTYLLKVSIYLAALIVLLLCIFWIPWAAGQLSILNPEYAYMRYPVQFGIYLTTIPFFTALYQANKLLVYIENNNAFSDLSIESLRMIKHCAISIVGLYAIGIALLISQNALHPSLGLIGLSITFASIVIAFFAALLQKLLKSVLEIKSENELTV
ncbi:DUF2975 domain-containing protein [Cytobacillus suaedae]|nr:DUF2975 domain-containing protein [Cytobacillus suaedae]